MLRLGGEWEQTKRSIDIYAYLTFVAYLMETAIDILYRKNTEIQGSDSDILNCIYVRNF